MAPSVPTRSSNGISARTDGHSLLPPGLPNLRATDRYQSGLVRNQAAQQEVNLTVMHLNHPQTIPTDPSPWKNCLLQDRSLVPKRLGTAALRPPTSSSLSIRHSLSSVAKALLG